MDRILGGEEVGREDKRDCTRLRLTVAPFRTRPRVWDRLPVYILHSLTAVELFGLLVRSQKALEDGPLHLPLHLLPHLRAHYRPGTRNNHIDKIR